MVVKAQINLSANTKIYIQRDPSRTDRNQEPLLSPSSNLIYHILSISLSPADLTIRLFKRLVLPLRQLLKRRADSRFGSSSKQARAPLSRQLLKRRTNLTIRLFKRRAPFSRQLLKRRVPLKLRLLKRGFDPGSADSVPRILFLSFSDEKKIN